MAKLKVKSKAPNFKLKDKSGKEYSLEDFDTDYKLLFFYPKDNTPGCTIEAKGFTKDLAKFKKLKTTIIGISGGDEKTKANFCNKHKLKVLLLSDTDFKISKKYDSFGKKNFMGKSYMGIFRKSFLLNDENKIIKIYDKVAPELHPGEILSDIKEFNSES